MAQEPPEARPLVIYDFDPNNLPPDFLQAVGLVITCASQTEKIMREFMGSLLRLDNVETIALGVHMSAPMKVDIIRAVAELNAPSASELDNIDDLLESIQDALVGRNAIAHCAFGKHPVTGEIFRLKEKARGSLQVDFQPVTVVELKETAKEIYDLGLRLHNFMVSRGLGPVFRQKPLREPINRSKKARAERRETFGDRY
jgi:hypothetical protein